MICDSEGESDVVPVMGEKVPELLGDVVTVDFDVILDVVFFVVGEGLYRFATL